MKTRELSLAEKQAILKHRNVKKNPKITICKVQRWATKALEQSYMDETKIKGIERPKCGEKRDLLMIQTIQAHRWSTVEEVS